MQRQGDGDVGRVLAAHIAWPRAASRAVVEHATLVEVRTCAFPHKCLADGGDVDVAVLRRRRGWRGRASSPRAVGERRGGQPEGVNRSMEATAQPRAGGRPRPLARELLASRPIEAISADSGPLVPAQHGASRGKPSTSSGCSRACDRSNAAGRRRRRRRRPPHPAAARRERRRSAARRRVDGTPADRRRRHGAAAGRKWACARDTGAARRVGRSVGVPRAPPTLASAAAGAAAS